MSKAYGGKGSSGSTSSRKVTFFVPGAGIDREVISTDICRYLGNDATARPGEYTDTKTGEITRGFYVTAYRALTTEQLADIKADSLRWLAEKKQPISRGQPSGGISPRASDAVGRRSNTVSDGYRQSATRRQQWNDPQDNYPTTTREPIRQPPQNMSTGRGFSENPYGTDQTPSGYPGTDSGYKIASFYETAPPTSNQTRSSNPPGFASTTATSRSQPPYGYPPTSAQYSYVGAPQNSSSGTGAPGYAVARETSPRTQYVDPRDEEMEDYYDGDYPQDSPQQAYGGRGSGREPERRDDRHRDTGRRHRH